jgi:hypothetical protein
VLFWGGKMNLSPLDMKLKMILHRANTVDLCSSYIDLLRLWESKEKTIAGSDAIKSTIKKLFNKGDLIVLEQNQEYQIMEGQKAFVGE